jgi:hypothetical protein
MRGERSLSGGWIRAWRGLCFFAFFVELEALFVPNRRERGPAATRSVMYTTMPNPIRSTHQPARTATRPESLRAVVAVRAGRLTVGGGQRTDGMRGFDSDGGGGWNVL